jgi:hypothetical protein
MVRVPKDPPMSDLVYRTYITADYPNARDCEHGHKRGKCETCDLIAAEARIAALEARVREVEGELATTRSFRDDLEADLRRHRDKAESARAAARVTIGELVGGLKPFAKYAGAIGAAFTGEERIRVIHGEPMSAVKSTPNVNDCRHAAALVARYPQ